MAKSDTRTFVLEEEVQFGFHRVCSSQVRMFLRCLVQGVTNNMNNPVESICVCMFKHFQPIYLELNGSVVQVYYTSSK